MEDMIKIMPANTQSQTGIQENIVVKNELVDTVESNIEVQFKDDQASMETDGQFKHDQLLLGTNTTLQYKHSNVSMVHKHSNVSMMHKNSNVSMGNDTQFKLDNKSIAQENQFIDNYTKMFKKIGNSSKLKTVECKICFKKMKEVSMKQHFKAHAGVKPFTCCVCSDRFTRKGDVVRHLRIQHGKERPHSCNLCQKSFCKASMLITHLQNHVRVSVYRCSVCGHKFGKKSYYETHVKLMHPDAVLEAQMQPNRDAAEAQLKQLQDSQAEVARFQNAEFSAMFEDDASNDESSQNIGMDYDEKNALSAQNSNAASPVARSTFGEDVFPEVKEVQGSEAVEGTEPECDEAAMLRVLAASSRQSHSVLAAMAAEDRGGSSQASAISMNVGVTVAGEARRFKICLRTKKPVEVSSPRCTALLVSMISDACGAAIQGPLQLEMLPS